MLTNARSRQGWFRRTVSGLTAAAAAWCCAAADAQIVPAPETGEKMVTVETFGAGLLRVRDARTRQMLMDPRGMTYYGADPKEAVVPQTFVRVQPTGFDIVYEFQNKTNVARPLGRLRAGVFTLGQNIRYRDFRGTHAAVAADATKFPVQSWEYPEDLYSPLALFEGDRHTVGVSLQYPVLEYKHDVLVSLASPAGPRLTGEGGRGWTVEFVLSDTTKVKYPARMAPGETRTYVVSVRFTSKKDDWLRTLLPYRNYFRSTYGGVQYQRETSPILSLAVANSAFLNASNPNGWQDVRRRPDQHGWGPWVRYITVDRRAYDTVVLWAPSGLYLNNTDNNFPFQFTSNWLKDPKLKTAFNADTGLKSVATPSRRLGLWWGNSARVALEWDARTITPLNPANPTHVSAAMREFELAAQVGATVIGLDAFCHKFMPIWDQIAWLERLKKTAPDVRFCIEPSTCDIMHRLAATFVNGWAQPAVVAKPDDLFNVKNPPYLADFLLPGHETWVGLQWHRWRTLFGADPTDNRIRADIKQHAEWGYRPVVFWTIDPPAGSNAAATWLTTVPADLQLPAGPQGTMSETAFGPSTKNGSTPKTPKNTPKTSTQSGTIKVTPVSATPVKAAPAKPVASKAAPAKTAPATTAKAAPKKPAGNTNVPNPATNPELYGPVAPAYLQKTPAPAAAKPKK